MFKFRKSTDSDSDLTVGSLPKKILLFSIPLMFSQLLQVLFNIADVAVVGKFASAEALGSVGSTTTMVFLFTGFLVGIGCGINVRTAQSLGAGRRQDTHETVHTSFLICLVGGVLLTVACLIISRPLLALLGTKDDLIDGAELYFKIYSLGMPAVAVFNCGNGVLSAEGDTRHPLFYLTLSGVLNLILNLFFVIVCHMAADGVALASIISQYLSAFLVTLRLIREKSDCRLELRKIRFYPSKAKSVLAIGIPAGLQNMIFAVANLFIQSGVNTFSSVVVEGNSAAANGDTLVYNILAAFYTACASFMGQNFGAGKRDRVVKSYLISMAYSMSVAAICGALLLLFGREFLYVFTNDAAVVEAGYERLCIMAFSFWLAAYMDNTIAASRGLGKSLGPTVIVILGSCVFRVAWVYTIFAHFKTIPSLYLLYSFSWAITGTAEVIYFIYSYKKLVRENKMPTAKQ